MNISAKDVKALRDSTGAGMMDAKKALVDCNGDAEAARQMLREKGLAKAEARQGRSNDEGAIALAFDDNVAVIAQLKTETDFSAKSQAATDLVDAIANDVLQNGPVAVTNHEAAIEDLKVTLKENIGLGSVQHIQAAYGNTLDCYLHNQDGRGVNAVVVEGSGVDQETLHQVALHIAFAKPTYLSASEIPEAEAEAERASLLEITKAEGKPQQAWDKIVDGRMRGWYAERVLLEQGLHGEKTKVSQTLGSGSLVRFVQVTNAA